MTIALSILFVFVVMACHWVGLFLIRLQFTVTLQKLSPKGMWADELCLGLAIMSLIVLSFVDVLVCAVLVRADGPSLSYYDAFEFSMANFTTIGAPAPPGSSILKLTASVIGMCGIFIFGWTASFLVEASRIVRDIRRQSGQKHPS